MKNLKKIILFFAVIIIEQFGYCAMQQQPTRNYKNYLYKKNMDHAHAQAANRLIEESYISPQIQWNILQFLGKKEITISTITGAAQGIPSIDAMLMIVNEKLNNNYIKPIRYAEKESIKNALHGMLEATELAIFVAAVEAAYRNQQYTFYQNVDASLLANLKEKKSKVENALKMVNGLQPDDQPASATSYFSWFTGSSTNNAQHHVHPLNFDMNTEIITIPAHLIEAIITKNDYKKEPNAMQAANLLFKECFIAQQHHLKDGLWIDQITINLQSPLTADNYIFTQFPDITQMCNIAQNLIINSPFRANLQDPMTQEQAAAHKLLLHMRQAIQTAIYIANAKSNYNLSYILPTSVASYLGDIVSQLRVYDAQLSGLCKDPMYGATPEDTFRDEQFSAITKYVAATVAAYAVTQAVNILVPGFGETIVTGAKNALGVRKAVDGENSFQTVKRYTDAAGEIGSKALLIGGGTAFFGNELRKADQAGIIPLNQIHKDARGYLNSTINLGSNVAIVGGTAAAVGGLVAATDAVGTAYDSTFNKESKNKSQNWWSDVYKKDEKGENKTDSLGKPVVENASLASNLGKGIWYGTTAIYQAKNVRQGAQSTAVLAGGALALANQLSNNQPAQNNRQPQQQVQQINRQPQQQPQQQQQPQPQQQQPQRKVQQPITTERVTNVFTQIITDNTTKGLDPRPAIADISAKLLADGFAPEQLQQAFAQTEQNLQLPENAIITGIQNLANNASQPQQ